MVGNEAQEPDEASWCEEPMGHAAAWQRRNPVADTKEGIRRADVGSVWCVVGVVVPCAWWTGRGVLTSSAVAWKSVVSRTMPFALTFLDGTTWDSHVERP